MTSFSPSVADIQNAARALHRGELVAFPTETVYGLGADADQDTAVEQIFKLKGRPNNHPLIVHISSAQGVEHYAQDIPDFAQTLMERFWPGALTLILHKRANVAQAASAQSHTIGLRWPSHPVALALLETARALGVHGVAAPSANRFGRVSPTRAGHVRDEFGATLSLLDAGDCDIGIESTIVDCTRGEPILLRPGLIDQNTLQEALNRPVLRQDDLLAMSRPEGAHTRAFEATAPKASGTLASHYAPRARVKLMDSTCMLLEIERLGRKPPPELTGLSRESPQTIGVWSRDRAVHALPHAPHLVFKAMPALPQDCAHALFATLRDFDALGVSQIWVESPPSGVLWAGVADRLNRASHTEIQP
jgi:L-threonylcarbamoyladenylate synthase